MTTLAADDISYAIDGRLLLDAVSLRVTPGEIVALVGPNGAGKSTLLRVLAGDLTPASGQVTLSGKPLGSYRVHELALQRAVMPQQSLLQFAFSAWDVVMMGRSPHQRRSGSQTDDRAIVDAALQRTETTHLAARTYPTLSGGEQGRVTLARVLAQATPILLLDEPTAALDIRHQQLVMDVARRLADGGTAVLAILHDLNLAAAYADRVALLSHGRIVACADPWTVFTEAILSDVFEHPVTISRHPVRGCPLVLPLPWDAGNPQPASQQITPHIESLVT